MNRASGKGKVLFYHIEVMRGCAFLPGDFVFVKLRLDGFWSRWFGLLGFLVSPVADDWALEPSLALFFGHALADVAIVAELIGMIEQSTVEVEAFLPFEEEFFINFLNVDF